MKRKHLYGTLLLAGLTLVSCKKEEETKPEFDPNKQIIIPRVAPIPAGNAVQQTQQPQQTQSITPEQMQMQQNTTTSVTPTQPGMNPPHGQPGHKCEIPVGSPLNSKPSQPQMTTTPAPKVGSAVTQQVSITPNSESGTPALLNPDANVVTEPGMNPPHGQPGHKCEIPVGSPLPK